MGLTIGRDVFAVLTGSALPGGAEARVYPVVAPQGATGLPFVTYTVAAVADGDTKDGAAYDTGKIEVTCIAKDYGQALDLAVEVRRRLTACPGVGDECRLAKSGEAYAIDMDAYVVELSFELRSEPDF